MSAKDFFQDIIPPDDSRERPLPPKPAIGPRPAPTPPPAPAGDDAERIVPIRVEGEPSAPPSGIRSIIPSRATRSRMDGGPMPPPFASTRRGRRLPWLWIIAGVLIVILAGLALVAFRKTTVTVTPREHAVVLSDATPFTGYPAATAASGTLAYTIATADIEDSQVVAASATTSSAAAKASGSITVYNSYSASSVKLIKNTRFASADGHVFRTPADIVVPGKRGATPGSVRVTVIADQTGAAYNVGPSQFTVPGLKGTAMYGGVYARSSAAMQGGADAQSGPGVASATVSATVNALKSSLAAKAKDAAAAQAGDNGIVLPDLMQISYTTAPNTGEAGGNVRIHEQAHVVVPVFDKIALGQAVGSIVSADTSGASISLIPGAGFAAHESGAPVLGTDPLQFTLTGQAQLLWNIDAKALAQALAGKDQGAFQTVISGFPGIAEAHARVEPFWKSTFPSDPSAINVVITAPKSE